MIIVTGGAGMIGSAIVWELNRKGETDIVIVDNLASTDKWKNLVNLRFSDYVHKDTFIQKVRDGQWPTDIKGVIHMGACSSTTELDADYLMENNFHYSRDLCQACLRHNVRFINASSAATYGDGSLGFEDGVNVLPNLRPLNMYGFSKQIFDMWAFTNGILETIASLKFFNVYGPNEYHKGSMRSVICKAVPQIEKTGRLELFRSDHPDYPDGGQKRDFIYVKDCAALVVWLLENPQVNGLFNVGTGKARTWNDLARAVFAAMGREENISYIDLPDALKGKYQYFTEATMDWIEREACPVHIRSLEEGVKEYVQEYLLKENPYLGN